MSINSTERVNQVIQLVDAEKGWITEINSTSVELCVRRGSYNLVIPPSMVISSIILSMATLEMDTIVFEYQDVVGPQTFPFVLNPPIPQIQSSGCIPYEIDLTLRFFMTADVSSCSFQLLSKSSGRIILSSTTSPLHSGSNTYSTCIEATQVLLTLGNTDRSGWKGSYVDVLLPDGSVLLHDTLPSGEITRSLLLNLNYSVHPHYHMWSYNLKTSPPSTWLTSEEVTSSWEVGYPTTFPQWDQITQYYVTSFTIDSVHPYSFLRISCVVYAGAVLYLNGHEVGRVNMGEGTVSSQTLAQKKFDHPTLVSFTLSISESFILPSNRLAIELHALDDMEETTSFDASVLLLLKETSYGILYRGASTLMGDLFDMNPNTVFSSYEKCNETVFYWHYSNTHEILNHYAFQSNSTCLENYPSGWVVEGSDNGIQWTRIHERQHISFGAHQRRDFRFYNMHSFSNYRIRITECEFVHHSICNPNSLYLADILFFSESIVPDCVDDLFPPNIIGASSYLDCPSFSTGYQSLYCSEDGFRDYDHTCWPLQPSLVQYPSQDLQLLLNQVMEPQVPLIEAWSYSVNVYPSLPQGLQFDSQTGTISGIPTLLSDKAFYTVTVYNLAGSIETVLQLEVFRKGSISFLSLVIEVVVVVAILCILVYLVRVIRSRNRSHVLPKQVTTD